MLSVVGAVGCWCCRLSVTFALLFGGGGGVGCWCCWCNHLVVVLVVSIVGGIGAVHFQWHEY